MVNVVAKTVGYFGGVVRSIGERFDVPDDVWKDAKRRPKWVELAAGSSIPEDETAGEQGGGAGDTGAAGNDDGSGKFDQMTVPELRAYAKEAGIDLGGATKKADILTLLNGGNVGATVDAQTAAPFGDNGGAEEIKGNGVQEALGGPAPDWVKPTDNGKPVMADE